MKFCRLSDNGVNVFCDYFSGNNHKTMVELSTGAVMHEYDYDLLRRPGELHKVISRIVTMVNPSLKGWFELFTISFRNGKDHSENSLNFIDGEKNMKSKKGEITVVLCVKGNRMILFDDKPHYMKTGEMVVFDNTIVHYPEDLSEDPSLFVHFKFHLGGINFRFM